VVRGISTAITVRRAAAIAIAGAAATALSACGAGLETQTDGKVSAIAGINADEGDLALRDLQVEYDSAEGYASGDDAVLRVWIGNEGDEEVRLTGVVLLDEDGNPVEGLGTVTFVSADAAEETPSEEPSTPGEDETTAADETTTEESADDAEETSTPAGDATSEAPTAPAFEGETTIDVAIAPGGYVRLDQSVEGSDYLLLEDLGEELVYGQTIAVQFEFSDGTKVPVDLPVGQALEPDEREYYEPEEAAEGH
jgi:hypothetical protein